MVPKKGEIAKHLARCLVDSKEMLVGEMSALNLSLGLRSSCNDLDVIGEGTINNKWFFSSVFCSCHQTHYNFVEISWPNHAKRPALREMLREGLALNWD